jgi:hypothetical protein
MRLEQTIDFMYDRLGQYLRPTIEGDYVISGAKRLHIRDGVCARTKVKGRVAAYTENTAFGVVLLPTNPKLLWMFGEQVVLRQGEPISMRITAGRVIAFTPKRVMANFAFAAQIPNLVVVDNSTLFEELTRERRYLFLAFTNKPTAVLGNNLCWSTDSELQVNGTLNLTMDVGVDNGTISLARVQELAKVFEKAGLRTSAASKGKGKEKEKQVSAVHSMRTYLQMPERNDKQQETLETAVAETALTSDDLRLIYNASNVEMIIANRLWKLI